MLAVLTNLQSQNDVAGKLTAWNSLNGNGYTIQYPDLWSVDTSHLMSTNFILFSPVADDNDRFRENVNMIVQDLTGYNLDLDQYIKLSEDQIKGIFADGELLLSARQKRGNESYHKMIYTGTQNPFKLKFEAYCWVVGNKAYILTLTCESDQFDQYKATGEKILDSFRLK